MTHRLTAQAREGLGGSWEEARRQLIALAGSRVANVIRTHGWAERSWVCGRIGETGEAGGHLVAVWADLMRGGDLLSAACASAYSEDQACPSTSWT